jgi:hypothetical protein
VALVSCLVTNFGTYEDPPSLGGRVGKSFILVYRGSTLLTSKLCQNRVEVSMNLSVAVAYDMLLLV